MINRKQYYPPRITVEKFIPNEYVAACWGVGCDYSWANDYEKNNNTKVWQSDKENGHRSGHCGSSSNQVIIDRDGDNIPDLMREEGTDGLGRLNCTIYSDEFNTPLSVASVSVGMTIYWTTSVGSKTWHHKGTVEPKLSGRPNHS